jgi:hypothetical protein
MPLITFAMLTGLTQLSFPSERTQSQSSVQSKDNKVKLRIEENFSMQMLAYSKPISESSDNFHLRWDELGKFEPAELSRNYTGRDFAAFLPSAPVRVGETWSIAKDALLVFLRQFHPGARLLQLDNGDSQAAYACLRAVSDRWAEIAFRIHAEFVLKEGFLTPSQFAGEIVFDRHAATVAFARIYVPYARVNFDTVWEVIIENEPGIKQNMGFTDAGCLPRLELTGGDPNATATVNWSSAVTADDAKQLLAAQFYAFKNIKWVPFDSALMLAHQSGKPLHIVAVGGTFDDESC